MTKRAGKKWLAENSRLDSLARDGKIVALFLKRQRTIALSKVTTLCSNDILPESILRTRSTWRYTARGDAHTDLNGACCLRADAFSRLPARYATIFSFAMLFTHLIMAIPEEREDGVHKQEVMPRGAQEPSPPPSPVFAPVGQPTVKPRFRSKIPEQLRLDTTPRDPIRALRHTYAKAVATKIDGADNAKFLEQFRYIIITSQLLNGHTTVPHQSIRAAGEDDDVSNGFDPAVATFLGALISFAGALGLALFASWIQKGGYAYMTAGRLITALAVWFVAGILARAYIRQQWLRYLRQQSVAEVTNFVARSQDFDSATSAAIVLIQEVELVSRGYRISTPLPPISRIEDRQTRKCRRLRKALKMSFRNTIPAYERISTAVKALAEPLDLERYYDMYDIGNLDISDAAQGFTEADFEDAESLRSLKIIAARLYNIRKIFLCALLALEARGDGTDFLRWTTAMEGLRALNDVTKENFERLRVVLSEQEGFPAVATPKMPLSPGRERWRSQLRKLGSLSTGIRGLQAKMALLREESDRSLNEAEDVSELGPSLMAQYESIGDDLKTLTHAWEEGKAALASGIDRNEKRLSSLSTIVMSPTSSLGGFASPAEGGGVAEALKALEGGDQTSPAGGTSSPGDPDVEEVFEAVAMPRPRKLFANREERLAKMREEREQRQEAKTAATQNLGMINELETVIKGRVKTATPSSRLSM
jgi:hypothetical protein